MGGKGGDSFLVSECSFSPMQQGRHVTPPPKAKGSGGGAGFGGGQASQNQSKLNRFTEATPIPKGNDAIDSRGATAQNEPAPAPGYVGMSLGYTTHGLSGDATPGGAAGACIVVVSESSVDDLASAMSSGGQGGNVPYGWERFAEQAISLLPGPYGGGSGQLMYFHVGGDA